MYFRSHRMSKNCLDHSLKNVVSDFFLTVNMLKPAKHFLNLHETIFIRFFIILKANDLKNISPNEI